MEQQGVSERRVVWLVWAVIMTTPTHQTTTVHSHGFLDDPCIGYRGVQGTCQLFTTCPALQHDLSSLSIPNFIERHGVPCAQDLSGNELFCCPIDSSDQAGKRCGQSRVLQTYGGNQSSSAPPWLVMLHTHVIYAVNGRLVWCQGALLSDRHVLVFDNCAPKTNSDMVVRVQGQVLNTGLAITGNWPVSHLGTRYSVNLLDTPATLTQDMVWPVCLMSDPIIDLGFRLDDFRDNKKILGYYSHWTISNGKQGRHLGQGLLSNCSLICEFNHNQNRHSNTNHNCPGYDLGTNLCVTGIHVSECQALMSTRGAPFMIKSSLSSDFFLVGLIERHTCSGQYPHLVLTPISHSVASAIKKIIDQ